MDHFYRFPTPLGELALLEIPPLPELEKIAKQECTSEERLQVEGWHPRRQRTFLGGRIALRRLVHGLSGQASPAILAGERGAPTLPVGFDGSISHKDDIAAAACRTAPASRNAFVGVDVELLSEKKRDVSRYILTEREILALNESALSDDEKRERVLRVFSLKEALYKALDRFVQRYVGFKEVEINWAKDTPQILFFLEQEPPGTFSAKALQLDVEEGGMLSGVVLSVVEVERL
ncbi:MAG: 4'-phosphopantetheinyl transferase superfamily protein [Deltaproteobacteria bacterium]|nr:4'-phosphopantetheinyl transferase superfamily protein [Deltaproteobacteria bacterium]